jgi:hypothetical protein
MADSSSQLCGYNIEKRTWSRIGIPLPLETASLYGRLLSDPLDENHLYLLGRWSLSNLYRIDLAAHTCTLLCPTSVRVNEFDAALVRATPDSEEFYIVAAMDGGSWSMYSSKHNSWKALPDWKKVSSDNIHNFLVYVPQTKTFYYHIRGRSTWEMVQL